MHKFTTNTHAKPLIGVGLRHPHYEQALSEDSLNNTIDFIEIHAENFFAQGGISLALLDDAAQKYKISVHGTSLGLGSAMAVPSQTLDSFAHVVKRANAYLVSEHLCFNRARVNGQLIHSGDLLPLAYNQASLNVLCSNICQVQDKLQRPILIENLSAYISAHQVHHLAQDDMSEMEFLCSMSKQSGCGLLLDLNNLIVNALNQQEPDPVSHIFNKIKTLPAHVIGEIHLAGFSEQGVNGFIVDDHANAVSQQCWRLYQHLIAHVGHKPTLIEWDNQLPTWPVLVDEAHKARELSLAIDKSKNKKLEIPANE